MPDAQLLSIAVPLMCIVVGLAYLLEIRNPLRHWVLAAALLVPVAVLVALFVHRG
jgi:hypothetical protein